jgi:hypothetical protein
MVYQLTWTKNGCIKHLFFPPCEEGTKKLKNAVLMLMTERCYDFQVQTKDEKDMWANDQHS